eukprot:GFUD01036523.1.p1 GENE.GFUD01036523.1~~GFUD01036523.1.p1  ORF type:complete len:884 (-),score=250.21 GFUD01036523.1:199-2850(-)
MMECDPSDTPEDAQSGSNMRKSAQKLIERYYFQLSQGCGNHCDNPECLSSGKITQPLAPNEAAARALHCLKVRARLCTQAVQEDEEMDTVEDILRHPVAGPSGTLGHPVPVPGLGQPCPRQPKSMFLSEEKLDQLMQECSESGNYSTLKQTLWDVFSSSERLGASWPRSGVSKLATPPASKACDTTSPSLKKMTKEEVRALEGEKDVDSSEAEIPAPVEAVAASTLAMASSVCTVDIDSLRSSYEKLFNMDNSIFEAGLVNALVMLCSNMEMDLKVKPNVAKDVNFLNLYEIVLELPVLGCEAYLENVVPLVCRGIALLPVTSQVALVKSWSHHSAERLKSMLENLQQILSLRVYTGTFTRDHLMNDDETISSCTTVIRIIYYASLLGGVHYTKQPVWDTSELPLLDTDNFSSIEMVGNASRKRYHDHISEEMELSPLDVRVPLIPLDEFYNEPLNETIEMDRDFAYWKMPDHSFSEKTKFSFMSHPFILNPATKAQALYYDNRIRMYSERRMNLFQSMMAGAFQSNPYLKLQVRRDHIVEDALVELEVVVLENPQDLKKQLMVEFDAEQGIDEGGLSKEFFQLIVEEIFNPDYGMFIHCPESHTYWFNPSSYESCAQFTLIGIVLGLAMYNSVILDLHLPSVIYRKLEGKKGVFEDLKEFKQSVWKGLDDLLEYSGDDMEDVFMQPFQINYTDIYGTMITTDLKEGGADIVVSQANKREYVDLYADFLLNKCVEKQFLAFQRGFNLVTSESPLQMMFTPQELEMLICGEKEFDFNELENSTEYDGGFSKETNCVRWFWEAVHSMDLEDKRKLLQFTTGSDRIPVGGLAKLKLIIAKNGPDSDRLPSAHTCFNVLLLPEYSSKEKMNSLLMKAIKECKGFGML